MKKIISYVLACCMCFAAFPVGVSGQTGISASIEVSVAETEDRPDGILESVISSFGDDVIVDYTHGYGDGRQALVITPDGKSGFFYENPTKTIIKVRSADLFPVDEINEKIKPLSSYDQEIYQNPDDSSEYILYANYEDRADIYNLLKEYDGGVESISEQRTVDKSDYMWMCLGVYIKNKNFTSPEEIIKKYPELNLKAIEGYEDQDHTLFEFSENIGSEAVLKEKYSSLKKLFNDYSDCDLDLGIPAMIPSKYAEVNTTIYCYFLSGSKLEEINLKGDGNSYYNSGTLEGVVDKFGEDKVVCYYPIGFGNVRNALVIVPDGKSQYFCEQLTKITVITDNDSGFSFDEINYHIKQYTYSVNGYSQGLNKTEDNDQYFLYVNDQNKSDVYNILNQYNRSGGKWKIYETKAVEKMTDSGWSCSGVFINNKNIVSDEDIISKYPELGLTKAESYLTEGYENYTYYKFSQILYQQNISKEIYSDLRKMFNDYSDCVIARLPALALANIKFSEVNTFVDDYLTPVSSDQTGDQKDDTTVKSLQTGDINNNKVVDMEDLIMLSQYLFGDIELTDARIKAADCNGDGVVDIADLSTLKQYIMGDDIKLGK